MNDPNGLVELDGVFHAFYQHHPDADIWGPMHWRHATSSNGLAWQDQGIALAPDALGAIFSGSAVVDHSNTSGLGSNGTSPVLAVFTHDNEAGQRQSIAYSLDDAKSWTTYNANPVLESDEPDFRDPKVFWHGESGRWIMSLAVGHHIEFYASANLRSWHKTGEFTATVSWSSEVWECPDLVSFDAADGPVWVLLVSAGDGGPGAHSGVFAFVGDFDGDTFTSSASPQPVDHGPDFYAAQSFSNRSGAPLVLGWVNAWQYANTHPSRGTRGVMSLPRLFSIDQSNNLMQSLLFEHASGTRLDGAVGSRHDAAFDLLVEHNAAISIDGAAGNALTVRVNDDCVIVNRRVPGHPLLDNTFEMHRVSDEPVRVILDQGTVELFADGGASALSALFFAGPEWFLAGEGDVDLSLIYP